MIRQILLVNNISIYRSRCNFLVKGGSLRIDSYPSLVDDWFCFWPDTVREKRGLIFFTWTIQYSKTSSIMKSTQCISVVPCYHLCCAEVKASASRCVFLKKSSIRTMICVLGKSKTQERAKSQQEQFHYCLFWDVEL